MIDMTKIKEGEYCLATKFDDGEGWDHWAVGFYAGEIFPGRHSVVDGKGNPFRAGGFRRCEPITGDQGAYLLANAKEIEASGFKLWDYVHQKEGSTSMTEPMSYSDAADILEAHNAWRRGQNDDTETPPKWRPEDTQTLGVAIDVAVDGLRKLQEENDRLRARCHALANACVTMGFRP